MVYDPKLAKTWWAEPKAGQVMWCWTSRVSPPEPGPVQHPALIYQVAKYVEYGGFKVRIAPGTSQKTDSLYPGELLLGTQATASNAEIQAENAILEAAGLTKPTKFSLTGMYWVDYNDEFFPVSWQKNATTPLLGSLSMTEDVKRRLAAAKKAAGLT